ncbi:putative STE group serine/threonine-protein kinase [Trypanosoma cruzi]|nr:putative STE group serine/threonine-protein kinase [Trypanosoma cruzi]
MQEMRVNDIVKGRYSTYQLQDLIGKGGNAVVYSAIDRSTGLVVAVKKIMASDDTVMATWRKEVAIISSLENPYIIRYIDHARSGNAFLIVTEYAQGGSLFQQLKRNGRFSEREVARFMFQITAGLAYIHEKKFLHRDLKCANVLIGAGDVVKLSDFGLAMPRHVLRDDPSGGEEGAELGPPVVAVNMEEGVVGSVYWMAPETIRGEPQNESSDIWSLGCVCVELLTGNPPFYDRALANAMYHIAQSDEIPIPHMELSEACESFLTECLNRDPTKRPSAASLQRHAWFGGFVAENILETLATAQAAEISAEQAAANSAAIARWVETNLFQEKAEQREQWLKGGFLKKVVAVLPKVTAEASYHIIRSFSFAAQRCRNETSCFLTQLGETDLWDNAQLSVLGKADSLSSLFVCCCERQDSRVSQYAPTHPGALCFLLQCQEGDVASGCIDALHSLMVGCEDDESSSPFSIPQEISAADVGQITFRRFVSQNRFVTDHAVYAVQRIIEEACCTAFYEEKEPLIGWQSLDKLFEVLLQVFKKTGDESIVVGPSMFVTQNGEGGEASNVAAVTAVDAAVAMADSGARGGGESGGRPGVSRGSNVGGSSNTNAAGGGGERQAEGKWLLALQEASRHLCPNAILLLLQFVHHATRGHLKSLNVGGKSIAGTFLVVASNASIDAATRTALLRCLPLLQCASQKAASFIRDTRCSVPLLAHAAKSIPVLEESREDEVMKVLFNLCEDERMAAALAASDAFLSIAVDRADLAVERRRWTEVVHAIRFIEILLAYSVDSSRVVESRGLLQLLLRLSDSESFPSSVNSAAQRLLNSVQVQTNVL